MDKEKEAALCTRLLDDHDAGTTDLADSELLVERRDYTDHQRFESEHKILSAAPTLIAAADVVDGPPGFATYDHYETPLLITKDGGESPNVFINACRHRGVRLVDDTTTASRVFTCRYHGWSYERSGTLVKIPDRERAFPSVDPASCGLTRVPSAVAHGLLWIMPAAQDQNALAEHLGALDDDFSYYRFGLHEPFGSVRLEARCNWKLMVEAFLETHHFRLLHPAMRKYVFGRDLSVVESFGPHVRLVAPKHSLLEERDVDPSSREIRNHATIVYFLFPSTLIFLERHHVSTLHIRAHGPDESSLEIHHMTDPRSERSAEYFNGNIEKFLEAVDEDISIAESQQAGLDGRLSRSGPPLVVGRTEKGIQLFRAALDRHLGQVRIQETEGCERT